jgi:hypothetical protein
MAFVAEKMRGLGGIAAEKADEMDGAARVALEWEKAIREDAECLTPHCGTGDINRE